MFLGGKLLVCSKRTRPSIIGDGKSTVDALIDKFNSNPLRGKKGQENFALGIVEKNKLLQKCLADQGVHLKLKLDAGKKVFLSEKTNFGFIAAVVFAFATPLGLEGLSSGSPVAMLASLLFLMNRWGKGIENKMQEPTSIANNIAGFHHVIEMGSIDENKAVIHDREAQENDRSIIPL